MIESFGPAPRRELPPNPELMCAERLRHLLCSIAFAEAGLTGESFDSGLIGEVVSEVRKRLKRRELPIDRNDDIGYRGIVKKLEGKLPSKERHPVGTI